LYESKLQDKKGKAVAGQGLVEDTTVEHKIADVCDLLGEVSIENGMLLSESLQRLILESFDTAVQDLTRALELKVNLYEASNPIISEAHYKLSLALEFAQQPNPEENKSLALEHLELALESVKQRLAILESEGKKTEAADTKEMIDELSIKVEEMKNPSKEVDVGSMFDSAGGFSEVLQQKLAETLAGGANDLTGLVRKKGKPQSTGELNGSTGDKRKIEGDTANGGQGKKVRVEDVEDEG
jgi:HAT1-interacting factor 1